MRTGRGHLQRTLNVFLSVDSRHIIAIYGFNLMAMVLAGKESGMQNVPFSEKVRRIVFIEAQLR
jgi:hypothetical protein